MHDMIRRKMLSLRTNLLSAYADSATYPAPVAGREREIFLHGLLSRILPPHFRVGSGVITDCEQSMTGQMDLVIELPLSLSFPVVGENRLFFADTVGAAIEVKSDLSSQWQDAEKKQHEVNALISKRRKDNDEIVLASDFMIPYFIVAYRGPKSIKTIEKKFKPRSVYPAAGIYVIESNLFVGYRDGWLYSETEAGAMLAFITSLYTALSARQHQPVELHSYIK